MKRGRIIALIVAGAAIGSILTSFLFYVLFNNRMPRADALDTASSIETTGESSGNDQSGAETALFERDISGDCVLFGHFEAPDDAPIAGARLGIWLLDQAWSAPGPGVLGRTNEKGAFSLPGVNKDIPILLYASAPGFTTVFLENPDCSRPLALTAERAASLDISLKNEKGDPVPNATVLIVGDNLWPPRTGRADREGMLHIEGVPEGEYAILAIRQHRSAKTASPVSTTAGKTATVSLALLPRPATKLRALDAALQSPLAGVPVIATPQSAPLLQYVMQTGKDGTVSLPCPDTEGCAFLAGNDGFVDRIPVTVSPGGTQDVYLKRGGTVSGVVSNRQGDPVQGARLMVDEQIGGESVSLQGSEGTTFNRMLIKAAKSGWPAMIAVDDASVNIGPAAIPVPKGGCSECRSKGDKTYWTATDESGRFSLNGLPARQLTLYAVHPEMVMAGSPTAIDLSEKTDQTGISIIMRRGSTATIRVVEERGISLSGASVVLFDRNGAKIRDTSTDKDGYVELKGLPGGFRIEASFEEYVSAVSKVNGRIGSDHEITLSLGAADNTLSGRVKDKNGFGLSEVAVVARSIEKGTLHVVTGVTDSDGTFALEGVGRGRYGITADGGERGRARVSSADFRSDVNLVLEDPETAKERGTIIHPDPNWSQDSLLPPAGPNSFTHRAQDTDAHAGADNLGVASGGELTQPGGTEAVSSSTRYGEADALPVTGPPPGRGGLPIQLGGGKGRAVVTGVAKGSRVEIAGLTAGCRIISVDGRQVSGPADAKRAISGAIGSVVMLEVIEPGNPESYTIVVQRVRVTQ